MNKFTYSYPTKVYFGEGVAAEALEQELPKVGKSVMLAYGGGSVKRSGVYDQLKGFLAKAGKEVVDFSGIMPNWPERTRWISFWRWAVAASLTAAK